MRSPVSPEVNLQPKEIEPGLLGYECPQSGGYWIPLPAYEEWKSQQPASIASIPAGQVHSVPVTPDPKRTALICPESGVVMLRYKAGQGVAVHIDRSLATGGVWLTKARMARPQTANAACFIRSDLNLIFTASYQRDLRSAEYAQSLEKVFQDRIGQPDFHRVAEFKEWMTRHPKHRDIWCYLSDAKG